MKEPETTEAYMGLSFHVQLLKVSRYVGEEIQRNCTHVKDNYWIFEGNTDSLNSKFEILGEGIVEALGGFSQKELIEICDDAFGVKIP